MWEFENMDRSKKKSLVVEETAGSKLLVTDVVDDEVVDRRSLV